MKSVDNQRWSQDKVKGADQTASINSLDSVMPQVYPWTSGYMSQYFFPLKIPSYESEHITYRLSSL